MVISGFRSNSYNIWFALCFASFALFVVLWCHVFGLAFLLALCFWDRVMFLVEPKTETSNRAPGIPISWTYMNLYCIINLYTGSSSMTMTWGLIVAHLLVLASQPKMRRKQRRLGPNPRNWKNIVEKHFSTCFKKLTFLKLILFFSISVRLMERDGKLGAALCNPTRLSNASTTRN